MSKRGLEKELKNSYIGQKRVDLKFNVMRRVQKHDRNFVDQIDGKRSFACYLL